MTLSTPRSRGLTIGECGDVLIAMVVALPPADQLQRATLRYLARQFEAMANAALHGLPGSAPMPAVH